MWLSTFVMEDIGGDGRVHCCWPIQATPPTANRTEVVFSSLPHLATHQDTEEFNPSMWIALRNANGYGADVDVPRGADLGLLRPRPS